MRPEVRIRDCWVTGKWRLNESVKDATVFQSSPRDREVGSQQLSNVERQTCRDANSRNLHVKVEE